MKKNLIKNLILTFTLSLSPLSAYNNPFSYSNSSSTQGQGKKQEKKNNSSLEKKKMKMTSKLTSMGAPSSVINCVNNAQSNIELNSCKQQMFKYMGR